MANFEEKRTGRLSLMTNNPMLAADRIPEASSLRVPTPSSDRPTLALKAADEDGQRSRAMSVSSDNDDGMDSERRESQGRRPPQQRRGNLYNLTPSKSQLHDVLVDKTLSSSERLSEVQDLVNNSPDPSAFVNAFASTNKLTGKTVDGVKVLHLACEHGYAEVVKFLIAKGAAVADLTNEGRSPLVCLIRGPADVIRGPADEVATRECAKVLLRKLKREKASEPDKHSLRPIDYAAQFGRLGILEELYSIKCRDDEFGTALHTAAHYDKVDLLRFLINEETREEYVDVRNKDGRTAAYVAARSNSGKCLEALVFEYGARYTLKDLLKREEKHVRLATFLLLAILIETTIFVYFSISKNVTRTCDELYGMILQPYVYSFWSVFIFKFAQYTFDKVTNTRSFGYTWSRLFGGSSATSVDLNRDSERSATTSVDKARRESKTIKNATTTNPEATLTEDDKKAKKKIFDKYLSAGKLDKDYKMDDFYKQQPYLFLFAQVAVSLVSICIALGSLDVTDSAWKIYTDGFATIVHSGVPSTTFSILKMAWMDERYAQMVGSSFHKADDDRTFPGLGWIWLAVGIPPLVLVPPLLTHVIPACFVFPWIVLPVILGPLVARYHRFIRVKGVDGKETTMSVLEYFIEGKAYFPRLFLKQSSKMLQKYYIEFATEIYLRVFFTFLFQSNYNYAHLLYLQPQPISPEAYFDIIRVDAHLRSQSFCWLQDATSTARGWALIFCWF